MYSDFTGRPRSYSSPMGLLRLSTGMSPFAIISFRVLPECCQGTVACLGLCIFPFSASAMSFFTGFRCRLRFREHSEVVWRSHRLLEGLCLLALHSAISLRRATSAFACACALWCQAHNVVSSIPTQHVSDWPMLSNNRMAAQQLLSPEVVALYLRLGGWREPL